MSPRNRLQRKVTLYISSVALSGLVISLFGWAAIYALFMSHDTAQANEVMTFYPIDYVAMVIFSGCIIVLSIGAAKSLSRRIIAPISSVAAAARRIAVGDQAARAYADKDAPRELVELTQDFNAMAERLQSAADDQRFWNAAIAHELRTPVTVLRGRLQGVADGVFALDDKLIDSLVPVVDSLARLVEDLRVASLAASGHLSMSKEVVALGDIIESLRLSLDSPMRAAGFTPSWGWQEADVVADPARIRQAMLALIENVRRHAGQGPFRCEAEIVGTYVHFRVIDAGPGVAPEMQPHIFDRFERGGAQAPGTGLGLAVVKSIAEAHGGKAACRSAETGGMIFEILIPWPGA